MQRQEELKLALVALNACEIRREVHGIEKIVDKREDRFTKYLDKCVAMISTYPDGIQS